MYMKRYDVCFMMIAVYHQGKISKDFILIQGKETLQVELYIYKAACI